MITYKIKSDNPKMALQVLLNTMEKTLDPGFGAVFNACRQGGRNGITVTASTGEVFRVYSTQTMWAVDQTAEANQ